MRNSMNKHFSELKKCNFKYFYLNSGIFLEFMLNNYNASQARLTIDVTFTLVKTEAVFSAIFLLEF